MEAGIRVGRSLAAATVVAAVCQPAVASDWDIRPTVTAQELFTDNVNLSQTDRESDFITVLRPGISIERKGAARSHLSLDFSLEHSRYLRDSNRKDTRQYLNAEAGAEIWENVFFLDGAASIDQRTISNTAGESATAITDSANRTRVITASINPNFRHHFRNWADYRFDYNLSNVRVASDTIDSTVTQRMGSTLTSGREFAFLQWTAQANDATTTYRSSNREINRRLAQLSVRYVDRILFQPTASIGYEKIEDQTLLDQPDGLIWSVGGVLRPGPRTNIQFSHGQRYGNPNTSLDASYEIGPKTTLTASYSQVLETSQSLSLTQLDTPTTNLSQPDTGFSLTDNAFRQSDFSANVNADRGRNDYRLEARWSERKSDADAMTTTIQSVRAEWRRALTQELSGSLSTGYRNTKTEGPLNRTDDQITLSAQLNYRLQEDLTTGIGYTGTRRISTSAGTSYTENAATFTVTAQF